MMKMKPAKIILTLIAVAILTATFFSLTQQNSREYNVVLITLDTVSANHLGIYGYYRNTTPNIDNFAKNSIVYSHAIAQMPLTIPSHVSILTSQYVHSHGAIGNTYRVNHSLVMLQKILKENNYETGGVVSIMLLNRERGWNKGFDFFDDNFTGKERRADETTDIALSWLDGNAGEKFFLWAHYYDPHTPYYPPAPYNELFDKNTEPETITVYDSDIPKNVTLRYDDSLEIRYDWQAIWNLSTDIAPLTADDANVTLIKSLLKISELDFEKFMAFYNRKIALHDGEIAYVDSQIERIFDSLRQKNLLEKTIVVIVADHGENFNHGEFFDHGKMFEQDLHVPLILYYPGVEPKKVDATVSLIDIAPTILRLLNIPPGKEMAGKNLLEISNNCDCVAFSESPYFKGFLNGRFPGPFARYVNIENNEWKMFNGTLFNLIEDPDEKVNLYSSMPDVVQNLTLRINDFLDRYNQSGHSIEQSNLEVLKRLGYVN